jgi:ribosomal protein S18 acetylase RimI-like enzyme
MIRAEKKDKELVIEILARSFNHNKSVNYIIKQDSKKDLRLRSLMAYSFDVCHVDGDVLLSDDKNACALVLFPDKKKTTLRSVWWDIRLILDCIGLSNIRKVLVREAELKKRHPKKLLYYLWYIGVDPAAQHKGAGSRLLTEVMEHSKTLNRPIYLETSTEENLPWYRKHGFRIYNELDLGYKIYFLKQE